MSELGIKYTCQRCTKKKASTRNRTLYSKKYIGPCGDSFCYASCDRETCRPKRVTVCDECAAKLGTET